MDWHPIPEFHPCANACGDLNGDSAVNLSDFSTFAVCFGLSYPTPACGMPSFECADLNGDATVDLVDFSTFSVLFGSVAAGTVPNCFE